MKNLSTRGRVAAVVVLSAAPALAWMVYGALQQRYLGEAHAREELQRYARLAARQQDQALEGARQLLLALSAAVPALLQDRQACQAHFRDVGRAGQGAYHALGVHLVSGDLHCNAMTWDDGVNVADRYYFRAAVDSGRFTVGGYQSGAATTRDGVVCGQPVRDGAGNMIAVVFARLDVKRLGELAGAIPRPAGAVVTLLDREGVVLAQHPPQAASAGETGSDARLTRAVLSRRSGMLEAPDAGGASRLYAFEAAGGNPDGSAPLRVVVGIHQRVIYADAHTAFIKTIGALVVVVTLLLLGGWYGAEV
ncbi:MAG: cache domain-containing protein, partial [Gammaproteobacteria bacterium]